MEQSYLEKIQIHKHNKLDGLHPGTKFFVVLMYMICTFVVGSVHLTQYKLSLLLIPWFLVVVFCVQQAELWKNVQKHSKRLHLSQ